MTQITKKLINVFKKLTFNQQNKNSSQYIKKTDILVCEEPVALIYNGISHTVMMCTENNLEDFALGFSLAEGIIQHPNEIYGIEIQPSCQGIEVHIELATRCFVALKEHRRTLVGRTGCGICGTESLKQAVKQLPQVEKSLDFDLNLLDDCLQKLKSEQILGQQTGASHAAAFFTTSGEMLAIREDVGRHIALDKLLGWHAANNKPQGFVLVTSRASYEMVQKTVTCGIEMLIAVSAATNLAVQMAEQSNLTLVGFARQGKANIYTDNAKRLKI